MFFPSLFFPGSQFPRYSQHGAELRETSSLSQPFPLSLTPEQLSVLVSLSGTTPIGGLNSSASSLSHLWERILHRPTLQILAKLNHLTDLCAWLYRPPESVEIMKRNYVKIHDLIPSYPILSYPILSHPIPSYPILSHPILSYPIVSYRIVSYRIVSYRIPFSPDTPRIVAALLQRLKRQQKYLPVSVLSPEAITQTWTKRSGTPLSVLNQLSLSFRVLRFCDKEDPIVGVSQSTVSLSAFPRGLDIPLTS